MFKSGKWTLPLVFSAVLLYSNYEEFYAEEDCTPCCSICTCSATFGGGGSWLYLRPLITPVNYARKVEITSYENLTGLLLDGKDLCFRTEQDSGFELFAFYQSPLSCEDLKWDLTGRFLSHRMKKRHHSKASDPRFLQPTIGFIPQAAVNQFTLASSFVETDFKCLNGEFGGAIDSNQSYFLRIFAGVQYANLKTNHSVDFTQSFPPVVEFSANETQVVELSRFEGVGPRIGFEGRIPIFCGISFMGDFGFNLLFSKKSGSLQEEAFIGSTDSPIPQSDLRLKQSFCSSRFFTPGIDGKVGIALPVNFWDCFFLNMELGYRGLYYWDAVTHLEIVSNRIFAEGEAALYSDSSTFERSLNFGLTGWFVGGSLQF